MLSNLNADDRLPQTLAEASRSQPPPRAAFDRARMFARHRRDVALALLGVVIFAALTVVGLIVSTIDINVGDTVFVLACAGIPLVITMGCLLFLIIRRATLAAERLWYGEQIRQQQERIIELLEQPSRDR